MNGFGYFEGDMNAVHFAQLISRTQKRKYKRYGIIPAAFFNYLKNIEAIKREKLIPEKYRTIDLLLDLLWETPKRNQQDRSEGECLRVEIIKDLMPWLSNKMGTAEHVWRKGQIYNAK
jgi:hypothetical protein